MAKIRIGIVTETMPELTAIVDAAKQMKEIEVKETNLEDIESRTSKIRALFSTSKFDVVLRCIRDILPPEEEKIEETYVKNSEQQYYLLPGYLRYDDLDLIISFNTSGSTPSNQPDDSFSVNGNVYFGAQVFGFDAIEFNKDFKSNLSPIVMSISCVNKKIFSLFSENENRDIVKLFKNTPNKPANEPELNVDYYNTAISEVNVKSTNLYNKVDVKSYETARYVLGEELNLMSCDTTHMIVNMSAIKVRKETNKKFPIIFVSPIENRYLYFDEDKDIGRDDSDMQSYVASYNGGIATLKLILKLEDFEEELYV